MVLSREADRIVGKLETGPYTEKGHQTLLDTLHKIFDRLDTTKQYHQNSRTYRFIRTHDYN